MTKIDIGGLTKDELFSMLEEHSIILNDYAVELFRCDSNPASFCLFHLPDGLYRNNELARFAF